jgi:hypothetical protein
MLLWTAADLPPSPSCQYLQLQNCSEQRNIVVKNTSRQLLWNVSKYVAHNAHSRLSPSRSTVVISGMNVWALMAD